MKKSAKNKQEAIFGFMVRNVALRCLHSLSKNYSARALNYLIYLAKSLCNRPTRLNFTVLLEYRD